jgi:archaellum component FlaG (FlaF/FlaG flagellin family)
MKTLITWAVYLLIAASLYVAISYGMDSLKASVQEATASRVTLAQ